jgi:hypothetical protein
LKEVLIVYFYENAMRCIHKSIKQCLLTLTDIRLEAFVTSGWMFDFLRKSISRTKQVS